MFGDKLLWLSQSDWVGVLRGPRRVILQVRVVSGVDLQLSVFISSVPMLVEQKELVIESEAIFTHKDLCK
jgi:hypothetical protein